MFDCNMVISLLQDSNVQSFIISMAAGVAWDGTKRLLSHIGVKEESLEKQTLKLIASTMQQFYDDPTYGNNGVAYNESIVMREFCEQFSKHGGVANFGTLRLIVDATIFPGLNDEQYNRWIDILIEKFSTNQTICRWISLQDTKKKLFKNRNLVLQRIEAKLKRYIECTEDKNTIIADQRFRSVFSILNEQFSRSWKDDFLQLVNELSVDYYNQKIFEDKLAFIRSNEDCCEVLAQIEEVISLCDLQSLDREAKKRLIEFIKYPFFNKVLIVAGTTGAGKTFFVKEYVKQSIKLLQEEAAEIIPCVIDGGRLHDTSCFEQTILQELGDFLGEPVPSLEAAHQMLKNISIKICFVIDNVHAIVDQISNWRDIETEIRQFSRYEVFKWILTINEYEYYIFEDTQEFLQRYCIKKAVILADDSNKPVLLDHALSIDALNRNWDVIKYILEDQFCITISDPYTDICQGISTPLEAIYFGECAVGEAMVSFPSTYFDYISKIVTWKSEALAQHGPPAIQQAVLKILDSVIESRTSLIQNIGATESEMNAFRHVQLLSKIETPNTDIFSVAQSFSDISYQLRVFPFWAAKMVGGRFQADTFDVASLLSYPHELKEWIIPCYIFISFDNKDNWDKLFSTLKDGQLLEYALFCAQRSSSQFCHALYEFLLQNIDYISNSRRCYAVLHFLYYCPLKMSEKFKIFNCIANQVQKNNLNNLYERVFEYVVSTSSKTKKLKRNMMELTTCNIDDINFILGYRTAQIFMQLVKQEGRDFDLVLWDIVGYIKSNYHLEKQIMVSAGSNSSFMDFFIRKCFEEYLCSTSMPLERIYQHMEVFFSLSYPFGSYIKRNLTCAAGNVFSSKKKILSGYTNQYIQLAESFAACNNVYEKETAYFLIKNSLSKSNLKLDAELRKILLDLITNDEIKKLYERDRKLFELDTERSTQGNLKEMY